MNQVTWAILGTGHMAKKFIAASRILGESCRVAIIGGRDADNAKNFANEHGVDARGATLVEAIAAKDVNAVYVALPNQLHEYWSIAALAAGKAVLCEKPAAPDLPQLQRMLSAAKKHRKLFYEGYLYRSHLGYFTIRDMIREGKIGRPILATASFCFSAGPNPKPRLVQPEFHGGSLRDVGVYPLGWVRLMLDEEPEQVAGVARKTSAGIDTLVAATLTFPSGALGSIRCSFEHAETNEATIHGHLGRITILEPWRLPQGRLIAKFEPYSGACQDIIIDHPIHDPMARQIDLFQSHIDQLEIPTMTWSDSFAQAKALDQIRSNLEIS